MSNKINTKTEYSILFEENNVTNPKISVVVAIYNVEKYLAQCLDSIISQSFRNIEIILVDNCSTDNTLNIAKDFAKKDSRIKIICHKENYGLPVSRNTGLSNAQGDYIFFMDSDDYLLPDIFQKLYENITSTESDVVVYRVKAFPDIENDKILIKKVEGMNYWLNRSAEGIQKVSINNFTKLLSCTPSLVWNKLYSKDFIKNNKIDFINGNYILEDNGFQIKVFAMLPKISYIQDIGIMYRIRNSAATFITRNKKRFFNTKAVLDDAINYIEKNCDKDSAKEIINIIKKDSEYSMYFTLKLGFFEYLWAKKDKKIALFWIPLFRQRLKKGSLITKILGITIKKEKYSIS